MNLGKPRASKHYEKEYEKETQEKALLRHQKKYIKWQRRWGNPLLFWNVLGTLGGFLATLTVGLLAIQYSNQQKEQPPIIINVDSLLLKKYIEHNPSPSSSDSSKGKDTNHNSPPKGVNLSARG